MKNILIVTVLSLFCLQAEVLEKIAVIVGNDIVLESEIKQMIMQAKMYDKSGASDEEIRKNVTENLISNLVLYNIAQTDTNITVEYNEIEDVLNQRINSILENVGGEENLKSKYNTSVSKLKNDFRPDVKKNLFIEKLKSLKLRKVKVSRSEVKRFFNDNKDKIPDVEAFVALSQLKINFGSLKNVEEQVYQKVLRVKNLILQDSISFKDAALKYSADNSTKENGGNLGMQKRGTFVTEFERVAYNLEEGELSDPVKTEFGYHLIKLLKKQGNKIETAHILFDLKSEGNADDAIALQKIEILRDSIINKKMTFEECVKKYSDDEKTRYQGGAIGNLKLSDLDESYRNEFTKLNSGDISIPFKQEDGYYLFKILDKQEKHKVNLEQDYNAVEDMALAEKKEKYLKKWIDELKEKVYIEVK